MTAMYWGEQKLSWQTSSTYSALIDTSSPYIVLDSESYTAFTDKLSDNFFNCIDEVNCFRANDSGCNQSGLESMKFDALSGVN